MFDFYFILFSMSNMTQNCNFMMADSRGCYTTSTLLKPTQKIFEA